MAFCHASESWHPVDLPISIKLDASFRWHDKLSLSMLLTTTNLIYATT